MRKELSLPTFNDGSVKTYKFTNPIPPQQLADGISVQGTFGAIDRALLMWRCEDHYMKREPGEAPIDLGPFYIISWQAYGPGYYGRDNVPQALEYYEKKGWKLMYSDGPSFSPKHIPDYFFNSETMNYEQRPIFVGDRMHKLPKGWEKINEKVIEEMDKKPSDKAQERLSKLYGEHTERVIKAIQEGQKNG